MLVPLNNGYVKIVRMCNVIYVHADV